VEVKVLDQSGHLLLNFTGTVTVASSVTPATGASNHTATPASLPITYTFTPGDHGEHTFFITFKESAAATGTATTLTATTTAPALTGSASLAVYPPTVVTHLGVVGLPLAVSGTAPVQMQLLNASNQVVTGFVLSTLCVYGPGARADDTSAYVDQIYRDQKQ